MVAIIVVLAFCPQIVLGDTSPAVDETVAVSLEASQ
jgi:hypothetical protein